MVLSLSIRYQKYIILSFVLSINIVLSVFIILYHNLWYIFIGILGLASFINSINVLLIIFFNIYKFIINKIKCINESNDDSNKSNNSKEITKNTNSNIANASKYIYVLPCYNETEKELRNTIKSIYRQIKVNQHVKILIIVCDGKISNTKHSMKTNKILTNIIFKQYITKSYVFNNAYKTWAAEWNDLEIHTGILYNMKFIILVKSHNLGKRDSLTLIRRMTYYYNKYKDVLNISDVSDVSHEYNLIEYYKYFTPKFIHFIEDAFDIENNEFKFANNDISIINIKPIDYIIGTDADTVLDINCSNELIISITNADENTFGVVGFVDIIKSWNPLIIYQYCEYLYAQCLKRYAQSIITKKVSCLSGCVQLIKVCKETCGNVILDKFNYLPFKEENIFKHIRSYASEDRNHICLMFDLYPYVKTIQNMNAVSYTNVPNTIMKFIRQRKRWCAGANCNDLLLVINGNHNKWERIQSFVNVFIFTVSLFVFISTVLFIISIVNNRSLLMLILASIMILPAIYSLLIPFIIYDNSKKSEGDNNGSDNDKDDTTQLNERIPNFLVNKINNVYKNSKLYNIIYYYSGFIIYYALGSILSLVVYLYTFYYLDDLNWNSKKISNDVIDVNDQIEDNNSNNSSNSSNNSNNSNSISNSSNNSDNTDTTENHGCDIKHTCNCLKWILTYGCSCKYRRNDDDEYNNQNNIEDNIDYNNENIGKTTNKTKSFININELWDYSEI